MIDAEILKRMAGDLMVFLSVLIVPTAHGPRRAIDVLAPFQIERFRGLAPALVAVAKGEIPALRKFFWEATKGASKDSDLAVCVVWLLAFSPRMLTIQVAAADADQADELRKAAKQLLQLNPWLADAVKIQNWRIINERAESACDIIAADVAGSHGARPDLLICNELSHVTKREFIENLMDNAAKVPSGVVIIATNAGIRDSWQWVWRENARTSPLWCFHKFDRPAPWLDPLDIEEARRRNTASRFARLWGGVWVLADGDGLDDDDIKAAVDPTLKPMVGNEPGFVFLAGLDIGTKHDRTGLVCLAANPDTGRIRVALARSWKAKPGGTVDLLDVQSTLLRLHRQFSLQRCCFDPSQAVAISQGVAREGLLMEEMTFTGANLNRMATAILETFKDRRIDIFPHDGLIADLYKLRIVERPKFGYALDAPSDKSGHADLAYALAIVLPAALALVHAANWRFTVDRPPVVDLAGMLGRIPFEVSQSSDSPQGESVADYRAKFLADPAAAREADFIGILQEIERGNFENSF